MNRGKRPKIKLTITDRRGKKGDHRGHNVGDVIMVFKAAIME